MYSWSKIDGIQFVGSDQVAVTLHGVYTQSKVN